MAAERRRHNVQSVSCTTWGQHVHHYSCLCDRFPWPRNDRDWGLGSVLFAKRTETNSAEILRDDDWYDLWGLWHGRHSAGLACSARPRRTALTQFCPLWSRTTKHASCSSTDQRGGKRRVSGMARRSWYYRVAVKLIFVIFGILGASAAQAQNAPWCLQTSSLGGYQSCTYATFEQCLVDRAAKNGFCTQNSTYRPGSPAIRRR